MDSTALNPAFMKTLLKCYSLKKRAKTKVSRDKIFFRQVLRVFKWRRRIKADVKSKTSTPRLETPSVESVSSSSSSDQTARQILAASLSEDSFGSGTITSVGSSYCSSGFNFINSSNNPPDVKYSVRAIKNEPYTAGTRFAASSTSPATNNGSSANGKDITKKTSHSRKNSVTDLDIVRRNLWLVIVRKDIVQAQRRRGALREQKQLKSRSLAYRCQMHLKALQQSQTLQLKWMTKMI